MKSNPAIDPGLIYDFGMDQCQDTDFYLKKGFRVVAVDANPSSCAKAAKRFARQIAKGRLVIVNRVISETGESLPFHVCITEPAWSTASPHLRDQCIRHHGAKFETVAVEGASAAEILATYGPAYFAKIDLEGHDLICLKGFETAPVKPTHLSTEVDFHKVREHIDALTALGYNKFALVSQRDAPKIKPPVPALEGRSIDHTFAHHASGVFGRELRAVWTDAAQMYRQCRKIYRAYRMSGIMRLIQRGPIAPWVHKARLRLFPTSGDWYDIHATRS